MRSSVVLVLVAIVSLACGEVPGQKLEAVPVVVVKGQVNVAGLRAAKGELRVALAWAGVPAFPPICVSGTSFPKKAEACGDPFAFAMRGTATSIPLAVDADGVFTMPLSALPRANVTISGQGGRVGYGSFVVFADANETGALETATLFGPEGFPDRGDMGMPIVMDQVLGASFASLLLPQHRLVLREGRWDPIVGNTFYPPGLCEPPEGFSLMRASFNLISLTPTVAFDANCAVEPIENPLEVLPLSEDDARKLECPAGRAVVLPPGPEAPETPLTCVDANTVVTVGDKAICPVAMIIRLKGCVERDPCDSPDWDMSAHPPSWWPACTDPSPTP